MEVCFMKERKISVSRLVMFLLLANIGVAAEVLANASQDPIPYGDSRRADVQAFIAEMVANEGFKRDFLEQTFAQASYKQKIVDAISRPAERTLNWREYQDIFLTDRRTREGKAFMLKHKATLARAYRKYGVPPEVVVAIIGVETMYGTITGNYRVNISSKAVILIFAHLQLVFYSLINSFPRCCLIISIYTTLPAYSNRVYVYITIKHCRFCRGAI